MDGVAQPELFGGLFVGAERERRHSVRARLKELTEIHGPLVPQSVIPVVIDLSKQRVSQLIQEGRLPAFEVAGKNFVPLVAIEFFQTEERKAGRPVEDLTFRETWKRHVGPLVRKVFQK